MRYGEVSRRLVVGFKHGDRTHAAPAFGRWLARAGAELLGDADIVAPVPLHWRRLFRRRYNQSAELARALARLSGVAALPDGLARTRQTPTQGGLNRRQRRTNVRDAFAVPARHQARIAGKHAIVIDDVMTTGATVEACAAALLDAGAAKVDVLCLARVEVGAVLS